MALHQIIGQIRRRRSHRYATALSLGTYACLLGIKEVLGTHHGTIAAVLKNTCKLYMETSDYDEAIAITTNYWLGIETIYLGLSSTKVAVTLRNIATVEYRREGTFQMVSLCLQTISKWSTCKNLTILSLGCL